MPMGIDTQIPMGIILSIGPTHGAQRKERAVEQVETKVDVLAQLRTTYCSAESYAAIAELIEAAAELRSRQRDYLADPRDQRSNGKGRLVGVAAERVDAALARVGGGK